MSDNFMIMTIAFFGVRLFIQWIWQSMWSKNLPHPQAFTRSNWGYYRVKYNDGGYSMYMSKSAAKDYADIFGGKVQKFNQQGITHEQFNQK